MSRANPHAVIISEEQLVPSAKRLKMTKNNQHVASDTNITDTMLRFVVGILRHNKFYKPVSLTAISIPHRSDSDMHSEGQDLPLTKLTNTVKGTHKFRMEMPDTMIDDAFKKSAGYKYYKAKKAESDQEANVPSAFKKNVVPRKTRSLTTANNIIKEPVVVELAKSISIEEQRHQQRAILKHAKQVVGGEGSSAAHKIYYEFENILATDSDATQDSSSSDIDEERDDETDDSDHSDMDLSEDKPKGYDNTTGFGVFVYNKSTEPLKSTYLTVTTSSLE
ncbi:hypothetical protein Tco_1120009 [Tanacetum coccineum]